MVYYATHFYKAEVTNLSETVTKRAFAGSNNVMTVRQLSLPLAEKVSYSLCVKR